MDPKSNPNNKHHAAIQSKLLEKLKKLDVTILPSITYHDILPESIIKKLTNSGNHLARILRHAPDVHIINKHNKLIGIDIKTTENRNICIEILPILEKIHAQEEETDTYYLYHHKELMKSPKVFAIDKNIPSPFQVCISTNSNLQYKQSAKRLKELLAIYYPDVKIIYKEGFCDHYALWDVKWIESMMTWDEFENGEFIR